MHAPACADGPRTGRAPLGAARALLLALACLPRWALAGLAGDPALPKESSIIFDGDRCQGELPPATVTCRGPVAGKDVNELRIRGLPNLEDYFVSATMPSWIVFVNASVDDANSNSDGLCAPSSPFSLGPEHINADAGAFSAGGASTWAKVVGPYGAQMQTYEASQWDQGFTEIQMLPPETGSPEVPFHFRMGGQYKLCYSTDGNFRTGGSTRNTSVLNQVIDVWGVYDHRVPCRNDSSCMREKRHRCYVLMEAYNNPSNTLAANSNCVVEYAHDLAGFQGNKDGNYPRFWWSAEYQATYSSGLQTGIAKKQCGVDNAAPFLCHSATQAECQVDDIKEPTITAGSTDIKFELPAAINTMGNDTVPRFDARTVALCYCPDGDCAATAEFTQQVGLLLYYASKVCHNDMRGESECVDSFTGSTPQHRFSLHVLCPPDGCGGATQSRVKIVPHTMANDEPSWATSFDSSSPTGCWSAVHGKNGQNKTVLPAADNPEVDVLDGRGRQDFKIWNFKRRDASGNLDITDGAQSGFMFDMGYTWHEKRGVGGANPVGGETFDICYCDDACSTPGNWFKVGQMRFVPFQLVSAASATSLAQEEYAIEYANQPGIVGFYRQPQDKHVKGLSDGAMLKLVADPNADIDDAGCADDPNFPFYQDPKYDRDLVNPGPMRDYFSATAHTTYAGMTNATTDPTKMLFNGGTVANVITIKKAGFLAVCYCSDHDNGMCIPQPGGNWVLAARLTIRGPEMGHHWVMSTHVVFRLEFQGWGLTSSDMLRIIPTESECLDAANEQYGPRGAYTVTSIKLRCPQPCDEVGEPTSSVHGGITVQTLGSSSWSCNNQNEDCRTNDIKGVTVVNATHTELEFEKVHDMETGDKMTITNNVACHQDDPPEVCNPARLNVLLGKFEFADSVLGSKPPHAPSHYFSGHIVTVHPTDTRKVFIPVGWPDHAGRPRFVIAAGSSRRGEWTRHSKAITKLEIKGERALENLRVCWAFSTPTPYPKYTMQVGTITLEDPNTMQNCLITPTTLRKNQIAPWAPMIISFTTAGSQTGLKYGQVAGPSVLRLFFTSSTSAVYAAFGDGALVDKNTGEDEAAEARQYICGKLFRELWSSNPDLGFPMPRGCYYTVYGTTQEINIMFDEKNGLKAGEDYMLVMTGVFMDEARANQDYVDIFTMDDSVRRPYTAIERGKALLASSPMAPSYGTDGVEFLRPEGVKVTSSTRDGMMELTGSNQMDVAFRGERTGGGIKAGAILRIFLRPLMQWDVASSCVAICIPHDEITHPCGAVQDCKGDNLIPNFMKNYLKIVLPANMATMDAEVSHKLRIGGLVFPKGGFFPTTFGVELRRPDDTKPDYVETAGNYFFKEPGDGASVGKLVEFWGDGDGKPFRGDQGNVLYASLMLASTLFSAQQSGDAVMKIHLPKGYKCTYPETVGGVNPWQPPADLGVFGATIPQGTGAPFEYDAWSGINETCQYSLRQNGIVFAGSSLLIRITADNPDFPLQRTDERNRWSVELASKGYFTFQQKFAPVVFGSDAERGSYASNKPVLGRIAEAKFVPQIFARSATSQSRQMTYMRVFFKAEQASGWYAQIRLVPAAGFAFPDECIARDIPLTPFNYYSPYSLGHQKPTKRLPGITGCRHARWAGETSDSHIAVMLSGGVRAETYYAFETLVQNPLDYDPLARNTWQLFTTDQSGNRVDGTPRVENLWPDPAFDVTIGMAAINSTKPEIMEELPAYGVYLRNLDPPPVFVVANMTPSSRTGAPSPSQVSFRVPLGTAGTSTLRITAPEGFLWSGSPTDLDHLPPPDHAEANVLAWDSVTWDVQRVYAFKCDILVPDASPQHSVNELLVELGHRGAAIGDRLAAGRAPLGPVQAVTNAAVDFTQNTNLQSEENMISFQFMLSSSLPAGGAVEIRGPSGFAAIGNNGVCRPEPAPPQRGSPYEVESSQCCMDTVICAQRCPVARDLPQGGLECRVVTTDPVRIQMAVGPAGLAAGFYRFGLQALNPAVAVPNPVNASSPCGQDICWSFAAFSSLAHATLSDAPMYTPAFGIRKEMTEADMPTLTTLQAALTGRDDRPLLENSLVFFFKLTRQMVTPETLSIRAPMGYVFKEDCLQSVEVRGEQVYGAGQQVAPGDTPWPLDVAVLSCRGEGPNAFIRTDPGIGNGFLREVRYPFRIKVFNPRVQPASNKENEWAITYGDEASRPFRGRQLWTFKRAMSPPTPVSIGASMADSSTSRLWNPVTFTLAPHNTIRGAGMAIRVLAPPLFEFANTNLKSRIMVQPVREAPGSGIGDTPPQPKYDARPSLIWGDDEIDAAVLGADGRELMATVLSDTRELTAGRDYQITIFVYNPMIMVDVTLDNKWVVETYNSPGDSPVLPRFRDRIILDGFAIEDTLRSWELKNEDPATGNRFYNGLERVRLLYFEMRFPTKLETTKPSTMGDLVVIETPAGYKWEDCAQDTSGGTFKWEPPQDYELYLPFSTRVCTNGAGELDRSNMTFRIEEPLAIPAMQRIMFRVDVRNPPKTPHAMLNHWMITHYNGVTGQIMSTSAVVSWNIVPQLADVSLNLVGTSQNKAAGTQSRMSISFVPITDADQLYIRARAPLGFDFTGCSALTTGHEVISTDLDKIRVRASIFAKVKADIVLDNFKLGQIGGTTEFDLVTYLNNGEQMDESLLFRGGFELPGYLRVWDQSIRSRYMSNPAKFPGERNVRMAARATLSFLFTVTRMAEPNDLIVLSSPLYKVFPENFEIRRRPNGNLVATQVVSYIDGIIVAQLRTVPIRETTPGFTNPSYEVSLEVETPNLPDPSATSWTIELRKPGTPDNQLPLNTNDGRTQGFRLVDNVRLQLKRPPTNEAPPMAEVSVELVVDPRSTAPTELLLMAPPMFNFSADCLVNGGTSGEIVRCTRIGDEPTTGRAQARLITKPGGLTAPTDFVVIRIATPAMDPADPDDRKWFLDVRDDATGLQVGWGEDPQGISIRQMAGAAVVFSGIPQIETQLSVRFYTAEKVEAGGKIRVYYPRSVVIMCNGDYFRPVALEGEIRCENRQRQGFFELIMARPMPPGQQAFTVTATPPDAIDDAGGNIFQILVYTPQGKVVDAAMSVPGNRVQHGITIKASELMWGGSTPGRATSVSFGFEVRAEMPAKEPPIMSEIVVTVPETLEQTVTRASHIEVLALPLPLREGRWLDVGNPRQVKLLMDEQAVATLPMGLYRFSFPVMLPTRMPKYNVYHVAFCEKNPPGVNTTCSGDPQDPRVITTFPLAGFGLGEAHPWAMQYMAAGAAWRRCAPSAVGATVLAAHALLWPLLRRALWP